MFSPHEWKNSKGDELNIKWRGIQIYEGLLVGKENVQVEVLNMKWRLNWGISNWKGVWDIWEIKGLAMRHKLFLWRVISRGPREAEVFECVVACSCVEAAVGRKMRLKYQGKTNPVSFLKVVYILMEELAARRKKVQEDAC
ncbi:hypothetical protein R1sor_006277 [Riccia sorocarpa]|uniref:Uncharacterized protein n=1 Tax=Riccia sorocarpa TaxID=122646 RepID=A0ABD3HNW6_9MARC